MSMIRIKDIKKETYTKVLDFLEEHCDKFALVDFCMGSIDFLKEEEMTSIKIALTDYCIDRQRVDTWDGTQTIVENEADLAFRHVYTCCQNSIAPLRNYNTFFEIENQTDIAFYQKESGECVIYTVSHENMLYVDSIFWKDFFKKSLFKNFWDSNVRQTGKKIRNSHWL